MKLKKELLIGITIGIIIGITGTILFNKVNLDNLFYSNKNKSTANYASSFLYRNTAPHANEEYYKETPILKAVVDDIDWKLTSDESNDYFYEGIFENWTDIDINVVKLEFQLYSDGVLLDKSDLTVKNIKSKEKVLVKIPLPRSYEGYLKTLDKLNFKIVGKSRDFKDKPFNKDDYIRS